MVNLGAYSGLTYQYILLIIAHILVLEYVVEKPPNIFLQHVRILSILQ